MFMLQYQPQIYRVICSFSFICLGLDFAALIWTGKISSYTIVNGTLQAGASLAADFLLFFGYFASKKHDIQFSSDNKTGRIARDWSKSKVSLEKDTVTNTSTMLVCQVLVFSVSLFWPVYEIIATSQITQPIYTECSSGQRGPKEEDYRIFPLISDLIVYLHLLRVRNAICLAICVLIVIDFRISFGRWNIARKSRAYRNNIGSLLSEN
jgi:hypothetical protein